MAAPTYLERLDKLLKELDGLIAAADDGPKYSLWQQKAEKLIQEVSPERLHIFQEEMIIGIYVSDEHYMADLVRKTWACGKVVLEAIREELIENEGNRVIQDIHIQYQLHPEIHRVSGGLFNDAHYSQAIFEACKRLEEELKRAAAQIGRSDLIKFDDIVNQLMGCDKVRAAIIAFNSQFSDAEMDEQKGFMFLFKGVVAIRNHKGHTSGIKIDDELRAFEYLALCSLLMRLLDRWKRDNGYKL